MTRLIDADALHEQFYDLTKFKQDKHTGDFVSQRSVKISDALRMINDAPTVEAEFFIEKHGTLDLDTGVVTYAPKKDIVEAVRCKNCRYRELDGEVTHFYWCRINDRPVDDDDFCTWGERKGGEDE